MSDPTGLTRQQVTLVDGWSGVVAVEIDPTKIGRTVALDLPSPEAWTQLLQPLLNDPTRLTGYAPIKYSDKGEVFRATLAWGDQHLDVVCKRFVTRGWRRHLPASLQPSKVRTNVDRSLLLLNSGIATAIPLATMEHKSGRRDSWLISEFVPDLVDLDQLAMVHLPQLDQGQHHAAKRAVTNATVDLIIRMEREGLHHRDFKATNVLLTGWEDGPEKVRPWLIDLEGLQTDRLRGESARWRPFVRLAASLLGYRTINRSDYVRFLQVYLERQSENPAGWKNHMRTLSKLAADYNRDAQKRKSKKYSQY